MDIDAMGKHVHGLLAFKKRIEEMLGDAGPAGETTAAEMLNGKIEELGSQLTELGEHISAIQAKQDALVSLAEDMTAMRTWFVENKDGLEVLLSIGDQTDDAGKAAPGATDAAGAGSAAGGTNAAPATTDAPAT